MRAVCAGVFVSLAAFVALIGAAIVKYPGGTWHDRALPGHHFWFNFLCDLLRIEGLNGKPNPTGSRFATAGMLALVAAVGLYFVVVPRLMSDRPPFGQWVLWSGELAAAGVVAVALLPSDRFGHLHTVAIFLAIGPGTIAVVASVYGVCAAPAVALGQIALGIAVVLSFVATGALFVLHLSSDGYLRVLPTMQRVATLVSIVWVALTTWQVFRRIGS